MNLAIEYILRNKRCRELLTIPTSLFLRTKDNKQIIITLSKSYGKDTIIVKHWKISETKPEEKFPPFAEYEIEKKDIFSSEHVVLKDCTLLRYQENPYPNGQKQYSEGLYTTAQESEYNAYIDNFYNNTLHESHKKQWLYQEFNKIYGKNISDNLWNKWMKMFLGFKGAAAELVFMADYETYSFSQDHFGSLYTGTISSGTVSGGFIVSNNLWTTSTWTTFTSDAPTSGCVVMPTSGYIVMPDAQ